MANPFTTGPFVCCTCPEPDDYDAETDDPLPTFINLCNCPTVEIECESVKKEATLCGFSEFEDSPSIVKSTPPKKYLKQTSTKSYSSQDWWCCGGSVETFNIGTTNRPYSNIEEYDPDGCIHSNTLDSGEYKVQHYDCDGEETTSTTFDVPSGGVDIEVSSTTAKDGSKKTEYYQNSGNCAPPPYMRSTTTATEGVTLSEEDTEDDALDRATETEGTDCTSIYELRTTSYGFTHRTVKYTATASNLVKGVSYSGCIRLQRRKAYSGTIPDDDETGEPEVIEWEDVAPDEIADFTASDTEEEVATEVELPIEQGWEYQIEGAYIYPASSDCECPSTYVAPEEE